MTSTLEERPVVEVMSTEVLTVADTETTLMAWELMRQGGYHHVPVVDADGRCVGVLDAETMAAAWDGGGPDRMRKPVSTVVGGRALPRVGTDDSLATAARTMLAAQLDFVPVTDDDEQLVGLVTARDLIATVAGRKAKTGACHVNRPALYRIEPVLPAGHRDGGGMMPPG
jgi:CBS domain-containing protein